MIPPPAPEEKFTEPEINSAWVAEVKTRRAAKHIWGADVGFIFFGGENQVRFLRRRKQAPSRAAPMSAGEPGSGTAAVSDDQLNLPSDGPPWVAKSQVAGVASKLVPVRVPVAEMSRTWLVLSSIMVEAIVNVKSPEPVIVHSGFIGVEGSKIHGCENKTDCPSGTLVNESDVASTSGDSHSLTPTAAVRSVVEFPAESWRMIPPPGPEVKLIKPMTDAAWATDPNAKATSSREIFELSFMELNL